MAKTAEMATDIDIYLPLLPDPGMGHVDQMVLVTVNGENTLIKRGEHVKVSQPVFEVLYNSHRFENL